MSIRILLLLALVGLSAGAPAPAVEAVRLLRTEVAVPEVEHAFALRPDERGVPRLDWAQFRARPQRIVTRQRRAVVLQNAHFRATLFPDLGRVHSFVHRSTGHEQLWINPAARPIPAHNDTGFWVTRGGVEHVLPRGEHGTSHALTWRYEVEERSPARKSVRAWSVEPLTGIRHTLEFTAHAGRRALETRITLENPGARPVRFSHWTTALFAPGGQREVTARTELIVPAGRFVPADKPFNGWMTPLLGPARTSRLRFLEAWADIGDLMATPLEKPFYAAYSHERDEAIARTVDRRATPGFNIWTWGFPPNERRQREYTAAPPNRGYAEFWNGTATEYGDAALSELAPGEKRSWVERMFAAHGLKRGGDVEGQLARLAEE